MSAPTPQAELEQLRALRREYEVTARVLAVVVELLLREVGGETLLIGDAALADPPDLRAWREDAKAGVAVTAERK